MRSSDGRRLEALLVTRPVHLDTPGRHKAVADPITVVVVDDHEMVREALTGVLGTDPGIRVVGTASTGRAGVDLAIAVRPDIVVMDFDLPDIDGAAATRLIKAELPETKVITVSGSRIPGSYGAVSAAGSSAWVSKTKAIRELGVAIHRVHAGEPVTDDELEGIPTVDQLAVHYQPVYELSAMSIVGFEALVRWAHPGGSVYQPATFLAQAELVGTIGDLDRRVGEVAMVQLRDWQRRFPTDPPRWVSVNLSGMDLRDPSGLEWVSEALASSGLVPSSVVLEITESVLIVENSQTSDCLHRLRDLGVRLALDDFGSGFSSLDYLRRFPFHFLKIDKGFTEELPHSKRAMRMVEAIQQVVSTLDLRGIAEGIERAEQAEALRSVGWSLGQGYLFSRPIPAEACDALLGDTDAA